MQFGVFSKYLSFLIIKVLLDEYSYTDTEFFYSNLDNIIYILNDVFMRKFLVKRSPSG